MEQLVQLVIRLTVMSLLAGAAELLVPDGNLRGSESTAVGLAVVSAVVTEIVRIFDALGV